MNNLYTINRLVSDTLASAIDLATGEIMHEDLIGRLEQLNESKDEVTLDLACEVKNLLAVAGQIKAEMDSLRERKARLESKAETLKRTIQKFNPGFKGEDGRVKVSSRSSTSVNVLDDNIVREFDPLLVVETIEYKADKKAIKAKLDAGYAVPGCELVTKENIQIK